jgi:uncharacterized phiE125 gp8 family phage protein
VNPSFATPAAEPVDSTLVKEWLRVDSGDTSQDAVITLLITAARQAVEDYLRRCLVPTTVTWVLDADQTEDPIWLPYPPVASITSVKTFDDSTGSEVATTVAATEYQLVAGHKLVQRNSGWGTTRTARAMEIVYVAGYGAAATNVPSAIREAVLRMIANHFEERQGFVVGVSVAKIPADALDLLERYRYDYL